MANRANRHNRSDAMERENELLSFMPAPRERRKGTDNKRTEKVESTVLEMPVGAGKAEFTMGNATQMLGRADRDDVDENLVPETAGDFAKMVDEALGMSPEPSPRIPQMVKRYIRETDIGNEIDGTMYDHVWRDRLTGDEVFRYDAADPANTDPAYGAVPDRDIFSRKGLDIDERVDAVRCVVKPFLNESKVQEALDKYKAKKHEEETAAKDLLEFLGDNASNFEFSNYEYGEKNILTPLLEGKGFTNISFYMIEADSFGPLIRGCVARDKDGVQTRFIYG